jgi:hypothetical protein
MIHVLAAGRDSFWLSRRAGQYLLDGALKLHRSLLPVHWSLKVLLIAALLLADRSYLSKRPVPAPLRTVQHEKPAGDSSSRRDASLKLPASTGIEEARWEGHLFAPDQTDYRFCIEGPGSGALLLDHQPVVEKESSVKRKAGDVFLTYGSHPFDLILTESGGEAPKILWRRTGQRGWNPVPSHVLAGEPLTPEHHRAMERRMRAGWIVWMTAAAMGIHLLIAAAGKVFKK